MSVIRPSSSWRTPQSVGKFGGHAGFRGCVHTMSCDAAVTQTCHHRPNSATAPDFAVLSKEYGSDLQRNFWNRSVESR